MTIIPAIDLKGGKCVRLRQGVASDATVYVSSSSKEVSASTDNMGGIIVVMSY